MQAMLGLLVLSCYLQQLPGKPSLIAAASALGSFGALFGRQR